MPERVAVVLATRNGHKVQEIVEAADLPEVDFRTLDDYPAAPEVVEDRDTFEDNARKKAREIAAATGLPALADDSGLVVPALGGEPGVRSARFSGPDATDASNRRLLKERMGGVADRAAYFVCVLALALPAGEEFVVEGRCDGRLLAEERGQGGFGYDPLFVPEGEERTFAEMTGEEKAVLSHRGRALKRARDLLRAVLLTL